MNRSGIRAVLTVVLLLGLLMPCAAEEAAGTEAEELLLPATPTDLDCAHENTVMTVYFFDSPAYEPVSPVSHRVSGPAVIETTCADCGAILSDETVNEAEEIRPHSMIRGVCPLCGYRENVHTDRKAPAEGGGPQEEGTTRSPVEVIQHRESVTETASRTASAARP